jgi:acyl dehydratase
MTTQPETYITDEIRAAIGAESEMSELSEPISASEVRRFVQAIMDPDRIYYHEEYAAASKYGGLVTPPLFLGFVNRRPLGSPDPLDGLKTNPELDGLGAGGGTAASGGGDERRAGELPPIRLPLPRLLNGGVSAEFYQLARPGDRIKSKRRLADVRERAGSDGMMVFIVTETIYYNQDDEKLAVISNTTIRR